MRQSYILIGACVLVLAGTWLASRALTEAPVSPTAPSVVAPSPAPPAPVGPAVVAVPSEPSTPSGPTVQPSDDVRGPTVDARALVPSGSVPAAKKPAEEAPPEEDANPFLGESRELDYADRLMWEEDGGVDRLKSARDVYERCIESTGLQRCKDGLAAVDAKLAEPRPTARPPPLPTIGSDVLKPSIGLPRKQFTKQ